MKQVAVVIDTSYLLELYRVPGHFELEFVARLKERWKMAASQKWRLWVPLPVLFELANHIVGVKDGTRRRELARRFSEDVAASKERDNPWLILHSEDSPLMDLEALVNLCQEFSNHAQGGISLTDAFLIREASRLKQSHYSGGLVHVWTRDQRLKSREPDAEADALF